jgi:predicted phosphodiesterase
MGSVVMVVASVAVLSDIHGVLPALDAVLAEPAVQAAERIVLPGDIAAGPQPVPVLDRLLGFGDRVTWVRGNADRELVELARGETDDVGDPIAPWAARQLSADHVAWLARLPYPVTLNVEGFGDVVFCHATPRDDAEVVVVDSRLDRWAEVLAGLPEQTMTVVCGHTHMPFTRLANRRQIINPCKNSRPTRTWPNGRTTSCTRRPATPTRSPSWPPATGARKTHARKTHARKTHARNERRHH